MIYIKDGKYFRICDDCGEIREIQRQTYLKNSKKDFHYCSSCYQKGERNHRYGKKPWNIGLTKETSEKVREYGEKGSISKQGSVPWNKGHTYEELNGFEWSENFKKKVSSVKKGKTNLKRRYSTKRNKSYHEFRESCRALLYIAWIRPILERDNYCCTNCGSRKNLEVHHLKPFRCILNETANEMNLNLNEHNNWPEDIFESFRAKLVDNHDLNDGITLCKECHKEIDMFRRRFYGN